MLIAKKNSRIIEMLHSVNKSGMTDPESAMLGYVRFIYFLISTFMELNRPHLTETDGMHCQLVALLKSVILRK